MFIYISKKQYDFKKRIENTLAAFYEETRDKNVIHKFIAKAFIDTNIKVTIEQGHPVRVTYHNIPLGKCSFNKSLEDDVAFEIKNERRFREYCHDNDKFTLVVGSFHDGCASGDIAYVEQNKTNIEFNEHNWV